MKCIVKSRTVWTGALVTVASAAAIVLEVWGLLGPVEMQLLDRVFGPGSTAVIGLLMIVLRVVTTQPLGRDGE